MYLKKAKEKVFNLLHIHIQKVTQPKWQKTKNQVTKTCDEPGISAEKNEATS